MVATKTRRKRDALVCGPDPYFATCRFCGKQEPMLELPVSIPAFLAFCKYLEEKHKHCGDTPKEPR